MNSASEKNDLQALCIICLQKTKQYINLFCDNHESKETLNKIYKCFQVTLSPNKSVPPLMCDSCVHELNVADNFRLKCITLNRRIELYLEENSKEYKDQIENNLSNSIPDYQESPESDCCVYDCSDLNVFRKVTEVNKSEKYAAPKERKTFKCNLCHKVLKTRITLLKHYVSMHEKRKHLGKVSGFGASRRYHCTSCSYSTPHSQTLVSHIRTHNGERPYNCSQCSKSFTQSSSLAAHKKTHSTATYFTCSLCGKQFKHAFTMKKHMRVHENASFACSICMKTLKSKETLQAHMHRHLKIRNYNCEDCGSTFVTSAELHNHRKNHSLEKKLQCHLCGYKTHTKKNLIMHLKRHTGNRTFKCDMCHVGFYTQSNLRRHMRVHTGDKPYSCPTCSQKFSYSPSLNKHMKTIHGVDYKWKDWKETIVKFVDKTDGNIPTSSK
ncbi:unnamed protein product [Spodoptera exigua]|nr:unnamed protein product [Spodoptera exigua]